jgi:1-deoxy-D-xylulose-5-phosphate reductoisomerase
MGKRITVDSATLMNKGFEVIEAYHLFDVAPENISVVIHRESILHSAVEYIDNTVIGEMSSPDMRMCVEYAVDYPERKCSVSGPLDLFSVGRLTFSPPDLEAFPLLPLAYRAISLGGGVPAVLNAADEVAVEAFLDSRLSFVGISRVVSETVERLSHLSKEKSLGGIFDADREARRVALELIEREKLDTGTH